MNCRSRSVRQVFLFFGYNETHEKIALGILAHVDAGKTTLSEALLFKTGSIRSAGRVDHGDTHLDTNGSLYKKSY